VGKSSGHAVGFCRTKNSFGTPLILEFAQNNVKFSDDGEKVIEGEDLEVD
jgi:hypothetical protein